MTDQVRPSPALAAAAARPQIPLPLLVTGIAGVAGYNAFHYFARKYPGQVVGLRRADNWPLQGRGIVGCDTHDHQQLTRLFREHRFASVLSCDGTCALRACEMDPPMAWRVNVLGMQNLLECLPPAVRFVHLSIDLVFSGTSGRGGYRETDAVDPVTVYGKTMVQAEQLILEYRPDALILRISLPMGKSFNGHAGAIDWIQSRFKKNKPATLYFDEVRTPTYTDCLNELAEHLLLSELSGLYHAGGPRPLSLYQIAQIVNRVGGYRPELLMGCPRRDAGPMPPRAGNVAMISAQLEQALGFSPFQPWPLDDAWVPTDPEWHFAEEGGRGSRELLAQLLYRRPAADSPLAIHPRPTGRGRGDGRL